MGCIILVQSDVHDARKLAMQPLMNAGCVSHFGQPGHYARTCPVS